jgi:hypothetical protein
LVDTFSTTWNDSYRYVVSFFQQLSLKLTMDDSADDIHQRIFVEVLPQTDNETYHRPTFMEALVVTVEPQQCGLLVKKLSAELPLSNGDVDLSHLKRVKRTTNITTEQNKDEVTDRTDLAVLKASTTDQKQSDSQSRTKRKRSVSNEKFRLEVLLGAVSVLESRFGQQAPDNTKINISSFAPEECVQRVMVPARLADSEEEWKEFNAVWPTAYFPNKTKEFLEQEMQLSAAECGQMRQGMEEALNDADRYSQKQLQHPSMSLDVASTASISPAVGVVVMCPTTGRVVATAFSERELQTRLLPDNVPPNPLSTPILLAIQGVSRLEREAAVSAGGMESESFQRGQYLCTGYDVYSTIEPTVFEAMALVHSRIRRLVFGCSLQNVTPKSQHACGGVTEANVHTLPGTNHHYRAFMCQTGSDVWQRCRSLND